MKIEINGVRISGRPSDIENVVDFALDEAAENPDFPHQISIDGDGMYSLAEARAVWNDIKADDRVPA